MPRMPSDALDRISTNLSSGTCRKFVEARGCSGRHVSTRPLAPSTAAFDRETWRTSVLEAGGGGRARADERPGWLRYAAVPRTPRITAADALRGLQRHGWRVDRQRGSHVLLKHPDHPTLRVVVPLRVGRILKPKTLASILDQAGLSVDDLNRVL